MKPSRSEKLAVFAELFVKLHILSSAQKDEIINVNKKKQKTADSAPNEQSPAVF